MVDIACCEERKLGRASEQRLEQLFSNGPGVRYLETLLTRTCNTGLTHHSYTSFAVRCILFVSYRQKSRLKNLRRLLVTAGAIKSQEKQKNKHVRFLFTLFGCRFLVCIACVKWKREQSPVCVDNYPIILSEALSTHEKKLPYCTNLPMTIVLVSKEHR